MMEQLQLTPRSMQSLFLTHNLYLIVLHMLMLSGLRRIPSTLRTFLRLDPHTESPIVRMSGYSADYVTNKLEKELKTTHLVSIVIDRSCLQHLII